MFIAGVRQKDTRCNVNHRGRDDYEQGKHVVMLILGQGLLRTVETCCGVNPRGRNYYEQGTRLCINLPIAQCFVVLIPAAGITANGDLRKLSQQNGVALHPILGLLRAGEHFVWC